ncbi:MAG TPA: hypothetical protein VGJ07_30920, partial [Rugosimonospora sp.]
MTHIPHARQPEDGPLPGRPDAEDEAPDVQMVPRGSVAVFQSPRAVRQASQPPAPVDPNGVAASGNGSANGSGGGPPAARPDIESPFLELFGANARRALGSTVDGTVVQPEQAPARPDDRTAGGTAGGPIADRPVTDRPVTDRPVTGGGAVTARGPRAEGSGANGGIAVRGTPVPQAPPAYPDDAYP